MKQRYRIGPSPTGFLHIGNLRTILFNYFLVKKNNADFIMRIEDTDQKREVEGSVENLIEILNWIGVKFDEGPNIGGKYGPYIQTERKKIYDKHIEELLGKGEAYHCFCTTERLEKMRQDQQKKKLPPRYDKACRNLNQKEVEKKIKAGDNYVIRQKMPETGEVRVHDEIRGDIIYKAEDLDDHVLIKSNGIPTYQFASVVDDHEMNITHVVRGEEWIPSFPKNILLYRSFGWTPPKFIHTPSILSKGGGKLSKRHDDVSVESYKEKGYLPEAIINFCALMGWHPKGDEEILSLEDIVREFDVKDIKPSGAIFDIEKLDFFNGAYIRKMDLDKFSEVCMPFLEENLKIVKDKRKKTSDFIKKVVSTEQERIKKLDEIEEATSFFFEDDINFDKELLVWKKLSLGEVKENLLSVIETLDKIPEENWTNDSIEEALITYIKASQKKVGDYLWPMRVALTGRKASPGPFEVAEVLGKDESIKRITTAIGRI